MVMRCYAMCSPGAIVSDFKAPVAIGQLHQTTASVIIEDVVATVLDITVKAWPYLCQAQRVSKQDHEDAISDQLRWEMDAEKQRRRPVPQLRFERETQSDDLQGERPVGRSDVYIIYSFDQNEYLAMECKKVNDRHVTPARKYIEQGVCRFSSGKYSFGHPYGTMVAFVPRGTPRSAAHFVAKKLATYDNSATRLVPSPGWRAESRFGPVPNLYSSMHGQAGSDNTILLLHLFLGFEDHRRGDRPVAPPT